MIERRRRGVVHLGRDTEFEWRQGRTRRSDRIRADLEAISLTMVSEVGFNEF